MLLGASPAQMGERQDERVALSTVRPESELAENGLIDAVSDEQNVIDLIAFEQAKGLGPTVLDYLLVSKGWGITGGEAQTRLGVGHHPLFHLFDPTPRADNQGWTQAESHPTSPGNDKP